MAIYKVSFEIETDDDENLSDEFIEKLVMDALSNEVINALLVEKI